MTYLQEVERLQRRGRARWPWVAALVALAVLVLVAGGVVWWLASSGSAEPMAAPATAPSDVAATTAVTAVVASPLSHDSSQAACQGIDRLVKAGTLDNMDQLRALGDAAADSPDDSVRIDARLLRKMAELAIAAKGMSDEADTVKKAREYAVNLQRACKTAGYA